jgi:hypothetical protein
MPAGMLLKSDGFASNLSDPRAEFSLRHYCDSKAVPYHDTGIPVPLDLFIAYGLAFQERFVPELEQVQVRRIIRTARDFRLTLDDSRQLTAQRVILAVGLSYFPYVPAQLSSLDSHFITHSSAHRTGERFRDQKVLIVGGGASAVDLAATLCTAGADVTVMARHPVKFNRPPGANESAWKRLRHPASPIGPGLRSRLYSSAPHLFYRLPGNLRAAIVRKHLGPAAGWAVKDQVDGKVLFLEGYSIESAEIAHGRVLVKAAAQGKGKESKEFSHVVAATGYKAHVRRISILDQEIVDNLRLHSSAPVLSPFFESSVSGLFFVGLPAAASFGPLLRFACGSDFAARRLAGYLKNAA